MSGRIFDQTTVEGNPCPVPARLCDAPSELPPVGEFGCEPGPQSEFGRFVGIELLDDPSPFCSVGSFACPAFRTGVLASAAVAGVTGV